MTRYLEEGETISDRPEVPDPLPMEVTFEKGERALYYRKEDGVKVPPDGESEVEPEEVMILWVADERDDTSGYREAKVYRMEGEEPARRHQDLTARTPLFALEKIGSQKEESQELDQEETDEENTSQKKDSREKDSQKKDQHLKARATVREKREIKRRAAEAGLSMSRYLVRCGLSDGKTEEVGETWKEEDKELREELRQLHEEIRRVGDNISELAGRLDRGERVSKRAARRAVEAGEQAADMIIEKLQEV
jgi:predicted DNA binding CopG/RHH family protein